MEDIGPSPDWRSGQRDSKCSICGRTIRDSRDADNCGECGREVCRHCSETIDGGPYCLDCADEYERWELVRC